MGTAPTDNHGHTEPPLWSMGLAALLVFVAPLILYSLAPSGPLREGDTIFSEGEQRAPILRSAATDSRPQQDTCLLDSGNPLIIVRPPADRADGKVQAQVQGTQIADWPYCPPLTEVLLMPHQIVQNPDMLKSAKEKAASFFRP